MCIIIHSPDGRIPVEHLRRSLQSNPDGWGYVFHNGNEPVARHGMTPREFWRTWKSDAKSRDGHPVIFHARIGTSGTRCSVNCHPFFVTGHGLWLAHNGILHGYAQKSSPLNDTQQFLAKVLIGLPPGWLGNNSICRLVEATIGSSKFALMDEDGNVSILNERLGHWHRNRWYSNDSYRPAPKPVAVATNGACRLDRAPDRFRSYLELLDWRRQN